MLWCNVGTNPSPQLSVKHEACTIFDLGVHFEEKMCICIAFSHENKCFVFLIKKNNPIKNLMIFVFFYFSTEQFHK